MDVLAGTFLFLAWSVAGFLGQPPVARDLLDWRFLVLLAVASLAWPIAVYHLDLYASQRRRSLLEVTLRLLGVATVCGVSLATANFLTGLPVSTRTLVLFSISQFAVLTLVRVIGFETLRILRRRGRNYRNILVIGSGPRAGRVQEVIRARPEWGLRIVGFVDAEGAPVDPSIRREAMHKLTDVPDLLRNAAIDEVIVACPRSMLDWIGPVVETCATAGVPLTLVADLFGDSLPPPRVTYLGSLVALSFARVHHSPVKLRIKRVGDVALASVGLVLAAPILALAALAIRANSPGPVLFRQERCGLNGRRFVMLKLRSMQQGAEAELEGLLAANEMDGPVFKLREDPRVTRVGQLLRRFSLDELPQLWNVLVGDMSIVGPRPPIPPEVRKYATFDIRRLSMRPGLTCLWQVSGRNRIGFAEWVKLDLQYIDNWSLSLDGLILLRTIPAVLSGRGAS
jgi:exopolysaccharide biosynthesis polyprenyl glycosylphosphotransferase